MPVPQHSGLEAKAGLGSKAPGLEHEGKEMVGLREDKNGEGTGGETRSCRDRTGESGAGLKRGSEATQPGTPEGLSGTRQGSWAPVT